MAKGQFSINVNHKQVSVGITDEGIFYDIDTEHYKAPSLDALKKAMQKDTKIVGEGIPVACEYDETQTGKVIGKAPGRGNYIVQWNNGRTEPYPGNCLIHPLGPSEKAHLDQLKEATRQAEAVVEAAEEAESAFIKSLSIEDVLKKAFNKSRK